MTKLDQELYLQEKTSRIEIRQKIEEAYANPIIKGQFSEVGQAKCGMQIKIVYKREGKNIVGLNAFPMYKEGIDANTLPMKLGRSRKSYEKKDEHLYVLKGNVE